MTRLRIDNLITIDESGMPKAPSVNQIIDKDILLLWSRDNSKDKKKYLREAGVIYYLADPRSPSRQQGLTDKEALKEAIEQFDLPKDYIPDSLVLKIIKRYYENAIGPAGIALENLNRSFHTINIIIKTCHDFLTEKLNTGINKEDIGAIIDNIDKITARGKEIPALMKAMSIAKENIESEEEEIMARGNKAVSSSMDADNN